MKKPKRNIPLLKRLRTRFLRMRHPKHFSMRVIAQKNECGTAMCVAGHVLDLAGYKRFNQGDGRLVLGWKTPQGERLDDMWGPMEHAQKLLGLTAREATYDPCGPDYTSNGLFARYDLKTPKQAAALIQEYIDGIR